MLAPTVRPFLTADRARPGTYSIVARDPATGELGAVATQANAEVSYGPLALDLLADGVAAPDALAQLLEADSGRAARQVAIVDTGGRVAAHTGEQCVAFAGDCQASGVSCQANIMASDIVWPAMVDGFEAHEGSLTAKLLAALDAAELAGGDLRGRQSAAILVVPGEGRAWDTVISLRVEDHPDPLPELARLVRLHEAYLLAGRGDQLVAQGRHDEGAGLYLRASELAPESHELRFWAGLGAARAGDIDTAVDHVRAAIAAHPGWRELLGRLTPEQAPSARKVLDRLDAAD
jgi:uncharacterized Ntn-hydrolase superfamily protein